MMHTHKIEEYDEDEVRDYVNDTRELAGYFNNHNVSFKSKLISDIDCYKRVLVTLRTIIAMPRQSQALRVCLKAQQTYWKD